MTITYYVARTAEGLDTPAQMRKVGTSGYGYKTVGIALRYTPPGGYVEERHTDGCSDWGGRIMAVWGGTGMREYPLTNDDLAEVGRRMARGESRIIPIRQDIELRDGKIAENCLTWGSPLAYRIEKVPQLRGALYYGRRCEATANGEFLEVEP